MKKEKYLQIFNYLLEFSKLRSNPVRNIESSETQYPDILWFTDIPEYDIFDSITFPNYNQDADYWLKIIKPKNEPQPPTFPKISDTLTDWIEKESLKNENEFPVLMDTIFKNGESISLADRAEVETEFKTYLNNKWIDDLDFYKKEFETYKAKLADYEKQSKIYKRLFSIYNKAQQFGEEFELIVGVGLLHFQEDANTPLICRHILTSKAEITFEFSARESFVKVSPSIENEIQIETDAILDLFDQFDAADIIDAEKKVAEFLKEKNISDSPFDNQIKEAIQIFADRLRTDGQSKDDLAKSKEIPKKPTVYFAPALILRKRNTRSFTALYEKIIENISSSDNSIDIPSINDIIGYLENPEDFPSDSENENPVSLNDETIYFPKKYNDEQIEIIEKARRNNKVLVQGPPGTGKSHTIANLICHLLANGKKVLVTAYTKRALEVLKNQLPEDFKNLTVNLLSGDSTSIQDLDASVNAINDELSRITNLNGYKKEIEKKEEDLSLLKEQKANTKNEWLKVKEKSTRRQNINRYYQGTLSEIAERIEKEIPIFAWFKDEFTDIDKINLITDIENFNSLTRFYQGIDCCIFNFIVPQKEKLFLLTELKEYRKIANDLVQKYPSKEVHITIKCEDYPELKKQLQELLNLLSKIENNISPFKSKVINDYRNNLNYWKDMLSRTNLTLLEMPDKILKHYDKSVEIKYSNDKSLIQVKSDAQALLSYINEGNSLSGFRFSIKKSLLPKNIKEKLYFIREVKVNGSDCDTAAKIQTVLADIKIKQEFEELETIWGIKANGKSYFEKDKFYRKHKEDIESLISLLGEADKIKEKIKLLSSIMIQDYESTKVWNLIDEVNFNILIAQVIAFKGKILEANKYLSMPNIHPIATAITKTIENIDSDKYEQHLLEIDTLNSEKEKYNHYKKLQDNLHKHFPVMVKDILENTFDSSNYGKLENAIHFKHAFAEILNLLAEDYETMLSCKLSDIERQEEKLISTIASKKAWLSVLDGLNKNFLLRQHLQAWVQAVKKIGITGKGKRALKFRKEAQLQMEKCKDSVPCWVMPLYKVAETINPEQGMYDYVIIDEASQLGADAIFLLYISKNIIIVGDDKQTSPEYVGVDANVMEPHIKRHLKDIPFANYYGTDFSFFDHAKRFCNGMTVLREHFRCMPEIIEFCNKHFYAPDGIGLYPLKQYSEKRLEPLKTVYCQNGYIDGAYQNITNRIEAEAIADKIAELVKDENYKEKTFGVIVLQGNAQAKLIESRLLDKIGSEEIQKRKIICGISASYQGDERDIMFLSLITAHNHNRAALTTPQDGRRYNVAVSRAKEQVWLFHSVQLEDLSNPNDLRYKLLNHFINYKENRLVYYNKIERRLGTQPPPFESWFEVDVYNDIVSQGFGVIPQYEVVKAKRYIDLVPILSNGTKIAVECDGDEVHGPEQYLNDLMREKQLIRCGWQFFRIRKSEYHLDRKKSLEPLWKLLNANINQNEEFADVNAFNNSHEEQVEKIISKINIPKTKTQSLSEKIKNNQEGLFDELFEMENPSKIDSVNKKPVLTKLSDDSNHAEILIFTSAFNVYKVQKKGIGERLQTLEKIDYERGEKEIYTTATNDYSGWLVVAFENGKVAKIILKSYQTEYNRKKLKNAFNNESKLIFIEHIKDDIDLVAVSSINKIILFNTSQINPVESRTTKGVQVMKSKDDSKMIKVKKLNQVKLADPKYYRKNDHLNVVGYYLKSGDKL